MERRGFTSRERRNERTISKIHVSSNLEGKLYRRYLETSFPIPTPPLKKEKENIRTIAGYIALKTPRCSAPPSPLALRFQFIVPTHRLHYVSGEAYVSPSRFQPPSSRAAACIKLDGDAGERRRLRSGAGAPRSSSRVGGPFTRSLSAVMECINIGEPAGPTSSSPSPFLRWTTAACSTRPGRIYVPRDTEYSYKALLHRNNRRRTLDPNALIIPKRGECDRSLLFPPTFSNTTRDNCSKGLHFSRAARNF